MFSNDDQYYRKLGIIKFLNHITETETPIQRLYIEEYITFETKSEYFQNNLFSKMSHFQRRFSIPCSFLLSFRHKNNT